MTLPIGYGDGYPRILSNRACVLVKGRRAPLAGRVCMDMLMADITDIPGVTLDDEVVLLGAQATSASRRTSSRRWPRPFPMKSCWDSPRESRPK